MEFKALF